MNSHELELKIEQVIQDPATRNALAGYLLSAKHKKVSAFQQIASDTTTDQDKYFFGHIGCLDELIEILTIAKSDSDSTEPNSAEGLI